MKKIELTGADDALRDKVLVNELNNIMHRKDYNFVEKALLIEELAKQRKCQIKDLAEDLGVSKKELYLTRKILDAPESVLERIKDGEISPNSVAKILYSLKDDKPEKVEEVVEEVISQELNQVEIESYVARKNDETIVVKQFHSFLWRTNKHFKTFSGLPGYDKSRKDDFDELFRETKVLLASLQSKVSDNNYFE